MNLGERMRYIHYLILVQTLVFAVGCSSTTDEGDEGDSGKDFQSAAYKASHDPDLALGVACELEASGVLVYDGLSHQVSIVPTTNCFSEDQLAEIGSDSMTLNVVAESSHQLSF
jgi:hypothetical protein